MSRRNVTLGVGIVVTAMMLAAVLIGPFLVPYTPLGQNLNATFLAPFSSAGGHFHLLGTDDLGRDLLVRTLAGGRLPVLVGVLAVLASGVLGVLLGLIAGYAGRATDAVLSRIADMQLSIPAILLALTLLAFTGASIVMLVVVIALAGWPAYFRLVRSRVLQLRTQPFIEASVASGQSSLGILLRHLLPNTRRLVIMSASLDFSRAILMEAGLSFLGLGVAPPTPDWGLMVSQGQADLATAWWIATFPGIAIMILVLGVNLIGDGLGGRTLFTRRTPRVAGGDA